MPKRKRHTIKNIIIKPYPDKPGPKEKQPEDWMLQRMSEIYAEGQSKAKCCIEFGICKSTFDKWRREYPVFDEAWETARLHGTVTAVDKLNKFMETGKGNWKALNMTLFNLAPDEYRLDSSATNNINIDSLNLVQSLTSEQLETRIKLLQNKQQPEEIDIIDVEPNE